MKGNWVDRESIGGVCCDGRLTVPRASGIDRSIEIFVVDVRLG